MTRIEVLQEICEYKVGLEVKRAKRLVSFLSYAEHFNGHTSMHICTYICSILRDLKRMMFINSLLNVL